MIQDPSALIEILLRDAKSIGECSYKNLTITTFINNQYPNRVIYKITDGKRTLYLGNKKERTHNIDEVLEYIHKAFIDLSYTETKFYGKHIH